MRSGFFVILYIRSKSIMTNIECIFCGIINHPDRQVVYEDDMFVIVPSKYPAAEKHFLFLPKKHVQSIVHVEQDDQEMLGKMFLLASSFAHKEGIGDYKLLFNAGKYAQIPHLHLHLLAGNLEDNT